MSMSRFAHRRRRLGAVLAGLCVAAGSVGTVALADSGSGTTVTVDANVMVQAGMTPLNARQAAANLNSAIDSAAEGIARAATTAVPSGRPVRTTAAASRAFATQVDAALTKFVVQTVGGLHAAGVAANNLTAGTTAALNQVMRTVPGAVAFTTGADIAVAGGADGAKVSASLNPVVATAVRQTIGDSVRALRPVLPLSRTTVRAVAAGVRQVVDASVVALDEILTATVDFTGAVLGVSGTTLAAVGAVVDRAIAGVTTIVAAVDATLDNLSDPNLAVAVDASLQASSR